MGAAARKARSLDTIEEPDNDLGKLRLASAAEDPYWQEVYLEMLRTNLCLFAKDILGLQMGPHLIEWGDMVNKHRRLALIAARDHSKSTFFSYAYPIWRAWTEPGCEVYLFSSTLDGAMEFLDTIIYGNGDTLDEETGEVIPGLKGMVEIPELQHLVPSQDDMRRDRKARLNRRDVRLTNGSRLRAVGYGKKIRGRHPKYIVLDDVLNDEDMYSETVRQKHIDYFTSAISNMVHPKGQIVCVGTPFHMGDLWGFLSKNKIYKFKRYPGIYQGKVGTFIDEHGEEQPKYEDRALFPWRWSLEALRLKKKEVGTVAFTREILCKPISDDLSIFPSFLFPPLYAKEITLRPNRETLRARQLTCFMGVDIAMSASVGADYFVIFVIGVDPQGMHYIVDIHRSKGLSFKRQLEQIEHFARRYDVALCFIEANQAQRVWSDEMKRTTDVPVKEFVTLATNKYPLDKGVPGLRILLENEKYVIPRGDPYSRKQTGIWIDEAVQFGFHDGKLQSVGTHDDTIMAWWMATEAKKHGGFSFAFGAEDDDDMADLLGEGEDGESWEDVMLGGEGDSEDEEALDPFAT